MKNDQIKLDYDDYILDTIYKINKGLEIHLIQLQMDNEEHDGFIILNVNKTEEDEWS